MMLNILFGALGDAAVDGYARVLPYFPHGLLIFDGE
jgi:hypothetical protein